MFCFDFLSNHVYFYLLFENFFSLQISLKFHDCFKYFIYLFTFIYIDDFGLCLFLKSYSRVCNLFELFFFLKFSIFDFCFKSQSPLLSI